MGTVQQKHAIWCEGGIIGTEADYRREVFDPTYPYTYCRICGDLFQPQSQREPVALPYDPQNAPNDSMKKAMQRRNWAIRHETRHTAVEIARYSPIDPKTGEVSARLFSPEAAHRLVPFGIIPLSNMIFDPEVAHAAMTAPRISKEAPVNG